MRTLNKRYRKKDRPTDVLAFETFQPVFSRFLGDIVISVDTAERQARNHGHSLEREIAILLVHGMVHLVGYDHEKSDAEYKKMKKIETCVIQQLQI